MRVFEVILILVNLLSLALNFKKQPKAVWLKLAGINLFIFLIHGILEGFRYQMIFSYVFVILFGVITLAGMNTPSVESKPRKAQKGVIILVSVVLLMFTSLLSYALPVFKLPKPTGSHAVGIQYFHLVDENRTDPFLDHSAQKRELMIKVYYPAQQDDSKPFSRYFHNSHELTTLFAEFYNLPGFMFDHLTLVKTNSKDDLLLSDEQKIYPIILFSHGAGTSMEVQTSQCEDLASHGYIVVAIDHTYASVGTVFPDRVVSHKEATTNFNVVEPAGIITQIMADDSSFVIDTLAKINEGEISSQFQGRLDLEKIGAIGHSVGGAVAYNLAINEKRIKAAINLDGVVFITPKEDITDMAPFLMLASDTTLVPAIKKREPLMKKFEEMDDLDQKITVEINGSRQAYQDAYNKAGENMSGLAEVLKSSGQLFTIQGSDHMKFIDIGLFIALPQLRELLQINGETDPAKCLEITKSVTLAFFDQHLKGTEPALEPLMKRYPQLQKVNLN